jgi:urease subunit beta
MTPGEIIYGSAQIIVAQDLPLTRLSVENKGDRPVQVGSHFHFAEANPALEFDRTAARGKRLAVPAGTSARFEPGIVLDIDLVPFGGARYAAGFRGEVRGPLDA